MSKIAAFFDVDGTLVQSNVVHYYRYLALRGASPLGKWWWYCRFLPKIPFYLVIDKIDRARFNRAFYRNYAGLDARWAHSQAGALFADFLQPRLFPGALSALRQHLEAGHLVVLVTGSLDFLIAPLQQYLGATDAFCVSIGERDGRFTGVLDGPPLSEEEKARVVREYAARHQLDLSACYAYGNDPADLPMLQAVGHPVAVNPHGALAQMAAGQGWEVRDWTLPP